MTALVKKIKEGRAYWYATESARVNGQPRVVLQRYLGTVESIEAAACGIPQVAGDSGGAPEAVVHGETGLLVERPGIPSEVASALEHLIGDPSQRRRLGQQSRRRAVDLFAYDVLAARLADYLTAVGDRVACNSG